MSRAPTLYWDEIASDYEALYQNAWSTFEDDALFRELYMLCHETQPRRILDIGCGTGLAYQLLCRILSNFSYTGVDVSAEMLARFQHLGVNTTLIHGSADQLDVLLRPCQFDLVLSTNVATSFAKDVAALVASVSRRLCSGGIARLSFLNRHSLRRHLTGKRMATESYRTRGDRLTSTGVPAVTISKRELIRLFDAAGFSQTQIGFRSVLGGVWESSASIKFEKVLHAALPALAHEIIATGVLTPGSSDAI